MKPIETGCRAVIVNSTAGNEGTIVTVGSPLPQPFGFAKGQWREIDVEIKSKHGYAIKMVREAQLRRLPDDEELSSWEEVQKVCKWAPNRETA